MSEQYSNLAPKYIQGILSTYKGNPTQIYSYRLNIYICSKGRRGWDKLQEEKKQLALVF